MQSNDNTVILAIIALLQVTITTVATVIIALVKKEQGGVKRDLQEKSDSIVQGIEEVRKVANGNTDELRNTVRALAAQLEAAGISPNYPRSKEG